MGSVIQFEIIIDVEFLTSLIYCLLVFMGVQMWLLIFFKSVLIHILKRILIVLNMFRSCEPFDSILELWRILLSLMILQGQQRGPVGLNSSLRFGWHSFVAGWEHLFGGIVAIRGVWSSIVDLLYDLAPRGHWHFDSLDPATIFFFLLRSPDYIYFFFHFQNLCGRVVKTRATPGRGDN
jgi:hypothetical protein